MTSAWAAAFGDVHCAADPMCNHRLGHQEIHVVKEKYDIAVVDGDGVGPEVCSSALEVLRASLPYSDILEFKPLPVGAQHFLNTGDSFPESTFKGCQAADAILHGAAGIPGVVHSDGTEAGLDFTLKLRSALDLYANIRPIKLYSGIDSPLRHVRDDAIDYIVVRENSEGLYASRGAGVNLRDEVAVDSLVQTRKGIERIVRKAFDLARARNGAPADKVRRVTCCDKANVLRSYSYFRRVFDEVASGYDDIQVDYALIDAMTVHLVNRPSYYDVIVCENMFGDIISDLGAATVGGMGMSPSAEVGDRNGFFQASHGSAPDIAGKGIANPYGTIISAASMLEWLGNMNKDPRLSKTAHRITSAVIATIGAGVKTRDIGGMFSTSAVTESVIARLPGI